MKGKAMSGKRFKKLNIAAYACVAALTLTGCGSSSEEALVPANVPVYNAVVPKEAEVFRGNLTPQFSASLHLLGFEQLRYQISPGQYEEMFEVYKMKIDEVKADVGKYVHKGDVLVSFHSEVLDQQIRDNEKKIEKDSLEIEHLKKLSAIDASEDHKAEIDRLSREIQVAKLYISDIRDIYQKMNLVSEADGYVSMVNESLHEGYVVPGNDLVIVEQSQGIYFMDPSELYTFKPGETYTIGSGETATRLEVIETPEGEKDGPVYFRPLDAEGRMPENSLKLEFDLPEMKDVCYVNHLAIYRNGDKYFAYVIREDDMRDVVEVIPGVTVGDDVVIREGLSGGEKLEMP